MSKIISRNYLIPLFSVIILGIIWTICSKEDKDIDYYFTMIGTLASVYGIVCTFISVLQMQSVTEATKKAVMDNNDIFNKLNSVSKTAEGERLGENIKSYLRSKNYDVAVIKMEEYIKLLIVIKTLILESQDFVDNLDQLKKQIPIIASEISNINKQIESKDKEYDILPVINNIDENIRTLVEIGSKFNKRKE